MKKRINISIGKKTHAAGQRRAALREQDFSDYVAELIRKDLAQHGESVEEPQSSPNFQLVGKPAGDSPTVPTERKKGRLSKSTDYVPGSPIRTQKQLSQARRQGRIRRFE